MRILPCRPAAPAHLGCAVARKWLAVVPTWVRVWRSRCYIRREEPSARGAGIDGGEARERRPWEFVWSVADGEVGGGGGERPSAAAKEWSAFVRSHLEGMYYK